MPAPDESFRKTERLLRSADYQRCYRTGRRLYGAAVNLHFCHNDAASPRFGITASRKVGKSVVRHRLKRQVLEVFRRWPGRRRLPDLDLVVHLKPGAGEFEFAELRAEVERLLSRVHSGRRHRSSRREGSTGRR